MPNRCPLSVLGHDLLWGIRIKNKKFVLNVNLFLEAEHKEKLQPLEQLQKDFDELAAKHEQFSQEHASALERSRLYDQDMLDKSRKIKDQGP